MAIAISEKGGRINWFSKKDQDGPKGPSGYPIEQAEIVKIKDPLKTKISKNS